MIKILLPCILFAATGAIMKRILSAIGREEIAGTLQDLVGVLILCMLCMNAFTVSVPPVSGFQADAEKYQNLQADTMQEVIRLAEAEVAAQIMNRINEKFATKPISCSVSIRQDNLELTDIVIALSPEKRLVSGYEVQKYIEEQYGGNAEVNFYE